MTEHCDCFFLTIIGFQNLRPFRPWIRRCTIYRRLGHHLKLCNRFCSQTDGCSYTVISCITTADYQYMFPFCGNKFSVFQIGIQKTLGYRAKIIHSKENIITVSSRYIDISRIGSATGKYDTVKLLFQFFCCNVFSHIHTCLKYYAFFFHQFDSAIQNFFIQLHIRDTVSKKSSNSVFSFKYGYRMSSSVQLQCSCQTGRTTSDDSYCLSCTNLRRLRLYPSTFISMLNDRTLIFLGSYRFSMQITGTCRLTQRRADTAGKLRKTVCFCKTLIRLFPVSTVYQIIGFRNQIVKRTSGSHTSQHTTVLAEGNAALHAACSLFLLFFQCQRSPEFIEMADSLQRFFYFCILSFIIQKSCCFSHFSYSSVVSLVWKLS